MAPRRIYPLIFATLLLIGCQAKCPVSDNKVSKELAAIEGYIDEHPDSALKALRSIPQIKRRSDNAKRALLLSMAEDRSGIQVTDDSLINVALKWYERHDDSKDLARTYYCLGRIQSNAESDDLAAISFTKSESIARNTDDYFLQGLLCQELASIYSASSTADEVVQLLTKANTFFYQSGNDYYYNHSLLRLADALDNNGRSSMADMFYRKADSLGRVNGDTTLFQRHNADSVRSIFPDAISAQRDYYEDLSSENADAARARLKLIIIISLLSLLTIAALAYLIFRIISNRNKAINGYISLLQEFKEKDSFRDTENEELQKRIRTLFGSTMGLIDKVSYKYSIHSHQPDLQSSVFKEVEGILDELKKDNKDGTLESILNSCYDDVIAKFRSEFPKLKEDDIRLIKYWTAGFSNDVMALFLNETIDNLYSRKSRLKHRILSSDTTSKSLFKSVILKFDASNNPVS
jgi:hypothetical protein